MFAPAISQVKRPKILVFGDSGVGKTTLALQFPAPAVIDCEGGTNLYGGKFAFDVVATTDWDTAYRAVEELAKGGKHKTLVIDPITILWDALQAKWNKVFLARKPGVKANKTEWFDVGPKEWQTIKAEWKTFMRNILALDMSLICTCREKPKYADGVEMRVIGETFDGEKSLPYWFDVVIRMIHKTENGVVIRKAIALKDRTGLLPTGEFVPTVDVFRKAFGEVVDAVAKPVTVEPLVVPDSAPVSAPVPTVPAPEQAAPTPPSAPVSGKLSEAQANEIATQFARLNMNPIDLARACARLGCKDLDSLSTGKADLLIKSMMAK